MDTNLIIWYDKWFEDGSGFTGWEVFTTSMDSPKGWKGKGWKASSTCGMGYSSTLWNTTNPEVVMRDSRRYFDITQEASDKLTTEALREAKIIK